MYPFDSVKVRAETSTRRNRNRVSDSLHNLLHHRFAGGRPRECARFGELIPLCRSHRACFSIPRAMINRGISCTRGACETPRKSYHLAVSSACVFLDAFPESSSDAERFIISNLSTANKRAERQDTLHVCRKIIILRSGKVIYYLSWCFEQLNRQVLKFCREKKKLTGTMTGHYKIQMVFFHKIIYIHIQTRYLYS